MVLVTARSRMGVASPWRDGAAAQNARAVSGGPLAVGVAAWLCLALWATSSMVLLSSGARDAGRVLACRYFTGAGVVERQYLNTGHGTDQRACPLVRVG